MLVGLEDRGTVRLVGVPGPDVDDVGPEAAHDIVAGHLVVTAATASADTTIDGSDGAVYAVVADPGSPGELERVVAGRRERLTDLNADLADVGLRPVERFPVARDDVELDAWAVLPDGDGPWPVLLNIHGGPTAQYTNAFFDEFQVYASAGYLVVGTNPRGSSGRGRDWCRAVVGAWTDPDSVDMLDLRSVVDAALERFDAADPDRIGIMGGSYGGFSTARIIARDHRFSSAVVERGLLAWASFGGTSDIGPFFDRMFLQATLPHDWEALRAASPLALADDVTTPTLVVHSQEDWRCPVEQAEQYWVALLRAGVDTEFLRFPGEGHELTRSGSPRHRVERFEAILDWHARHLGGAPPAGHAAVGGEGSGGDVDGPPDPQRAPSAPGVG
nr:prolyl oligopeptidase family serine peptidase [Salsipaludibacter albus]